MPPEKTSPPAAAMPERSAMVGSLEPLCAVCGRPRSPRKRETCSDACRTALNRRRKTDAEAARDRKIRAYLTTAAESLEAAMTMLGEGR